MPTKTSRPPNPSSLIGRIIIYGRAKSREVSIKAIILAAGSGRRLRAVMQTKPKCLLEIGGRSLLSRNLSHLESHGVNRVVLVVGFAWQKIRRAVADDPYSGEVTWVVNDRFDQGNMLSLWAARSEMDDDLIVMDADVLYCSEVLRRLLRSRWPTAVLMDETVRQAGDECMVTGCDGRVSTLNKSLQLQAVEAGETVGFIKVRKQDVPAMLNSIRFCVDSGKLGWEYEDALKQFIRDVHVGYEKIGNLPWIEIDTPVDVVRAIEKVLPAISAMDLRSSPDRIIDTPPVHHTGTHP